MLPVQQNNSDIMEKEKNIVIDFTYLHVLCGFGNIADNFLPRLLSRPHPGINYILIVPDDYQGPVEPNVDYIRTSHIASDLRRLGKHVDLWHITSQMSYFPYYAPGTIRLMTVHDLNFLYEKKGIHRLKHLWRLRLRVALSNYITTISAFAEKELLRHTRCGCGVKVIYNGITDMSEVGEKRPAFVSDGDNFFFAIGQILEKKNYQKLVPMMRFLPGYKLFICGDDRFPYAAKLRRIIEDEGGGRVFLTGPVTNEEKKWLYGHCKAFFFPSRLEGFGIPGIEALQMGAQVFASRLGSLPEILSDHAFYFDSFEPEQMAGTVKDGLQKPKDVSAMKDYANKFSYDRYTDKYIALYHKLLGLNK